MEPLRHAASPDRRSNDDGMRPVALNVAGEV